MGWITIVTCTAVVSALYTGVVYGNPAQCNVRQDPFAVDTTARSLGATFYIDLNNPFTCYGIITQFRFCYKKLAGALSDNVYIGAYQPNSNGDKYTRVGYNTIHINPLMKKDCLTVDANPQIVVDNGYVLAFYVTFAYFKFIEDPSHGYLYKSVAFPKSISTGVLIRTSHPYAPKLEAILTQLNPQPGASSPVPLPTLPTPTSNPIFPPPPNGAGIPFPDIDPNQCVVGVGEAFVSSYNTSSSLFLNVGLPAKCGGTISRWEMCYRNNHHPSSLLIGVWRQYGREGNFTLVNQNEITLTPPALSDKEDLCTVFEANMSEPVQPGDVIGLISPNISIAFSSYSIDLIDVGNDSSVPTSTVALVRAIIDQPALPTSSSAIPPSNTTPVPSSLNDRVMVSPYQPTLFVTSSSTQISGPPSSLSSGSISAIVIGSLTAVFLCVFTILFVLVGIYIWRNRQLPRVISVRNPIPEGECSNQNMTYNLVYSPSDHQQVIVNGRRETLMIKENAAYAFEDTTASDGKMDHTYEKVSFHDHDLL